MKLSKYQREALRMMFGGKCAYCGCELERGWCADHVEAIYRNWSKLSANPITGSVTITPANQPRFPERDSEDNLFPSCRACNIHKSVFGLEAWRIELGELTGFLQRGYPTYRHALRFGLIVETSTPIVFWFEKFKARESKT